MKSFKGRVIAAGNFKGEAVVSRQGVNTLATFQKSALTNAKQVIVSDQNNKDIFGLKGLTFDGFADFWWENHACDYQEDGTSTEKHTIFISEPQLWYNIGRHFGCDNLNVGTEIELSQNFGSTAGFKCRPCLGVKWNF